MRRDTRSLITLIPALAGVLSLGYGARAAAPAAAPDARPVPRVPLEGTAVSTIDAFNGFVGTLGCQGNGVDGHGNNLSWQADLSFMQGTYVARDGVVRQGTFAFI